MQNSDPPASTLSWAASGMERRQPGQLGGPSPRSLGLEALLTDSHV